MKSVTLQLADFVVETKYEDLPDRVVHEAKRVFLDSIGCALAGMAVEKGRLSAELAKRLGGLPESSIIGTTDTVSCTNAALANGELINALDFDAVLAPATHVAPFVLPPAIAIGEGKSASGKELILAVVLGHELSSRVASGLSSRKGSIVDKPEGSKVVLPAIYGYSANAFGSVASAGKMLKLGSVKMANAFGIAGYNSPMQTGAQWHHSGIGSLVKYASAGWIAQMGTTAALLAETGYTGDGSVLDGEHSFWRFAGSQEWRPELVVKNLGHGWNILNTRYKLYPCCGLIHTPLDCFTTIIDRERLMPEDIEQVKVWMNSACEMALWQNREISTQIQAQFSVAYVFALVAHGIGRGAEWQDSVNMKSPNIRRFMDKVTTAVHPDYRKATLEALTTQIARVEVVARGKTYSEEKLRPRGMPTADEPGVKDSELVEKFKHNASKVLPGHRMEEVIENIWELEKVEDISFFMKNLARQGC